MNNFTEYILHIYLYYIHFIICLFSFTYAAKSCDIQFDRNLIRVFFNPYILKNDPCAYDESDLIGMISKVNTKFSKLQMPSVYEWQFDHLPPTSITLLPRAVAIYNYNMKNAKKTTQNSSFSSIDLSMTYFVDTVLNTSTFSYIKHLSDEANTIFPGSVTSISLWIDTLKSSNYELVDKNLKSVKLNVDKNKSKYKIGLIVDVNVCYQSTNLLPKSADFLYLDIKPSMKVLKDGLASFISGFKQHFLTCKEKLNKLTPGLKLSFRLSWPDTNYAGVQNISTLVQFWYEFNNFAIATNTNVVLSEAFDIPHLPYPFNSQGWWLVNSEVSYEKSMDYIYEEKCSLVSRVPLRLTNWSLLKTRVQDDSNKKFAKSKNETLAGDNDKNLGNSTLVLKHKTVKEDKKPGINVNSKNISSVNVPVMVASKKPQEEGSKKIALNPEAKLDLPLSLDIKPEIIGDSKNISFVNVPVMVASQKPQEEGSKKIALNPEAKLHLPLPLDIKPEIIGDSKNTISKIVPEEVAFNKTKVTESGKDASVAPDNFSTFHTQDIKPVVDDSSPTVNSIIFHDHHRNGTQLNVETLNAGSNNIDEPQESYIKTLNESYGVAEKVEVKEISTKLEHSFGNQSKPDNDIMHKSFPLNSVSGKNNEPESKNKQVKIVYDDNLSALYEPNLVFCIIFAGILVLVVLSVLCILLCFVSRFMVRNKNEQLLEEQQEMSELYVSFSEQTTDHDITSLQATDLSIK